MHKITITDKEYSLPSKWNELTTAQILYLAKHCILGTDLELFKIQFLRFCFSVPLKFILRFPPEAVAELTELFEFIHKSQPLTLNTLVTNSRLAVNPLPEIKIGKTIFHGPDAGIQNLCFEEFFLFAETTFAKYMQTGEANTLDTLIASLYRPATEGIRPPFNRETVELHIKDIAKLDQAHKIAILLFYAGSRILLIKKFPRLFVATDSEAKPKHDEFQYLKLIDCLNAENVTNNEAVKRQNIYEVCLRLDNMRQRADELTKK